MSKKNFLQLFNDSEEVKNDEHANNFFEDGKVFKTCEELIDWVRTIGRRLGYVVVIKKSEANSNVLFACDRGGICKSVRSVRNTATRKKDCTFSIEGKYRRLNDSWVFRVINLQHNHDPSEYLEGHAYVRIFKDNEFDMVKDLSSKNLKPRDILSTIKKENVDNVSIIKTVYNARQKIRLMDTAGKTKMQVLLSYFQSEGYHYFTNASSVAGELQDMFFSHPTCLEKWQAFPHVLLIDATYKTNMYGLPLVEMVGCTSTNMAFSVAFVLLRKEIGDNYIWALDCLKSTLEGCMYPRVIVTHRELALIRACKLVFPDAKSIQCRWHIGQNIFKNCRPSIPDVRVWQSFKRQWSKLINSQTDEA